MKYFKPRILLLDMPPACDDVLRAAGYNVTSGSLGIPYQAKQSDRLAVVPLDTVSLPGYEEQEIIFVNLAVIQIDAGPPVPTSPDGVNAFWQSCTSGIIDPRPFAMSTHRSSFDNILEHGGVFFVFSSRKYSITYHRGSAGRGLLSEGREFSNWDLLTVLEGFDPVNRNGKEITFLDVDGELSRLLQSVSHDAHFTCELHPYWGTDEFISLAKNKFEQDVGGILSPDKTRGLVVLLPQMPSIHEAIKQLLEDWCIGVRASLFPQHDHHLWVERPEFQPPQLIKLQKKIQSIKESTDQEIAVLEEKIGDVRHSHKHWYDLLTQKDRPLVEAVLSTLRELGFKKTVDVDAEREESSEPLPFREDIQIRDESPVLIVEVKGLTGCPSDADCGQAAKHALMRIREWDRTDVQGLTIINHQRNLPPDERDPKPFRDEIAQNASDAGFGLLTTWDLFRLVRNARFMEWNLDFVKPILYRIGLIDPIPEHYKYVGDISEHWKNAFGIVLAARVAVGDRLAIETQDAFVETDVQSLQLDDKDVDCAPAESHCGIGYPRTSSRLTVGSRVFLITKGEDSTEDS